MATSVSDQNSYFWPAWPELLKVKVNLDFYLRTQYKILQHLQHSSQKQHWANSLIVPSVLCQLSIILWSTSLFLLPVSNRDWRSVLLSEYGHYLGFYFLRYHFFLLWCPWADHWCCNYFNLHQTISNKMSNKSAKWCAKMVQSLMSWCQVEVVSTTPRDWLWYTTSPSMGVRK